MKFANIGDTVMIQLYISLQLEHPVFVRGMIKNVSVSIRTDNNLYEVLVEEIKDVAGNTVTPKIFEKGETYFRDIKEMTSIEEWNSTRGKRLVKLIGI